MLNYGVVINWVFVCIGVMIGLNVESLLEVFGNVMCDWCWMDNVVIDVEVVGILEWLLCGLNEGGIGIGIFNVYVFGVGV